MIYRQFHLLFLLCFFLIVSLSGQLATKRYFIDQIQFEGNETFSSNQLKKIIKLKEPQLIKSSEFNRRSLKLDAMTLKNFYISEGFLNSEIEESFKINEFDRVDILFLVKEGIRSFLRSIAIEGNRSVPEKRILKILNLKTGQPFNPIGLRRSFSELEKEYGKLGKLFVLITPDYNPETDIHLTISIEEGPTVINDKIIIDGLSRVDSSLVLRELKIKEGTIYNGNLIEQTQRQIFETGLFSFVDISPVISGDNEDRVNIKIDLREFTPRELLIEPGISQIRPSSEGGELISGVESAGQVLHRNIFGTGIRFRGALSFQFPIESFERAFGIGNAIVRSEMGLSGPWLYHWRIPYTFRAFGERIPDFTSVDEFITRYGWEWSFLKKYTKDTFLRGGLRWAQISATQMDTVKSKREEKEQERSFRWSFRDRNLDNPIMPTKGTYFSLESSIVGWILKGNRDYYRVEMDYRRFFNLGSSRVLALRLKLGRMEPINIRPGQKVQDLIPSYDLFYLGGSSSLRGEESQRFQSYPHGDGNVYSDGGLIKILMNAEIRIPLWWIFGLDLFVDSGILARSPPLLSGEINEWKKGKGWNYGFELTVTTPLGPVRLYYAVLFTNPINEGIVSLGVPYAF